MAHRRLDLKDISFPQLCAVSRDLLQAEPGMDDSEWKARIKDRLVKWGFQYPHPESLAKAMDATHRAHERAHGQRPVNLPEKPQPVPIRQDDPPWRGMDRRQTGPTSVQELLSTIQRYAPCKD